MKKEKTGLVDPTGDMISLFLIRWRLDELLKYSRFFMAIMNRDDAASYSSEYSETLSIDHLVIAFNDNDTSEEYYDEPDYCDDNNGANVEEMEKDETGTIIVVEKEPVRYIYSFRHYFQLVYNTALFHSEKEMSDQEKRLDLMLHLRGCFLIALLYDIRIRRFVLSRHSIHYNYMHSRPPDTPLTLDFLSRIEPMIGAFLKEMTTLAIVTEDCINLWIHEYSHTV